jgi:deoxycytidylate deaminase
MKILVIAIVLSASICLNIAQHIIIMGIRELHLAREFKRTVVFDVDRSCSTQLKNSDMVQLKILR